MYTGFAKSVTKANVTRKILSACCERLEEDEMLVQNSLGVDTSSTAMSARTIFSLKN